MNNIIKNNTNNIHKMVTNIINNKFIKLNKTDKEILIKYLYKTVLLIGYYINNDNYINQISMNNQQDVFSMLVLLMPFYKLEKSYILNSLSEIFNNSTEKAKKEYESSYYIDHKNINVEEYFKNNLKAINNTMKMVNNNLLINWINIFPYTISDLQDNKIKNNFQKLLDSNGFITNSELFFDIETNNPDFIDYNKTNFLLGYDSLLGTLKNFLYDDIKTIKWIIYDVEYKNKIYPNIIVLCSILKINTFNKTYEKLTKSEQTEYMINWENAKNLIENFNYIKSLVLFYARFINFSKIEISKSCKNKLNPKTTDNNEINEIPDDEDNIDNTHDSYITECIKKIIIQIKFEDIYKYLFDSFQQFQYTWYGISVWTIIKIYCHHHNII